MSEPSDDALMKTLADRSKSRESKDAFRLLFNRHGGLVLGYCTRILADRTLAEDVAQDVWMKVIKNAATYEGRSQLRPWLLTIARNASLNSLRTRSSWKISDVSDQTTETSDFSASEDDDILTNLIARSNAEAIRTAIDSLPSAQRTALSLLIVEELNYEEIAKAMAVSVGAVKTHIYRGRQTLIMQFTPIRRELR